MKTKKIQKKNKREEKLKKIENKSETMPPHLSITMLTLNTVLRWSL